MTDIRKAAQAVLTRWDGKWDWLDAGPTADLMKDLRAALAEPEQSPLTNGEIYTAYIKATNQTLRAQDEKFALAFARAVEQAHGIGGKDEQ